jgi:hypothetical protein
MYALRVKEPSKVAARTATAVTQAMADNLRAHSAKFNPAQIEGERWEMRIAGRCRTLVQYEAPRCIPRLRVLARIVKETNS